MKRSINLLFLWLPVAFVYGINAQPAKTLPEFLALAKANSPLLNDYNNQCYALKIDSLKRLATYGFNISGNVDALYAPVKNGWGYDVALSNGQNVTAVLRVSKELLSRGNLKTQLADYSLSVRQLLNESKVTESALCRAVTEQYINTYAAQQQYAVSQEMVQLLQREEKLLKELTQQAGFKQTDYLSFVVTLQQNELTSQQLHANWLNQYAILNYLAGIVDTTLQKVEPPKLQAFQGLPYEQSVYAEKYKTDSLKLINEARMIEYDYHPKLSVFADAGYSSSFIESPYKNWGASVGLSLSIPIYDGDLRKKSLQQIHFQQDTRNKYHEFEQHQYQQQVLQIQGQIQQYEQMIRTANEQMKYAKALIDANLQQLPSGDVKVTDFILSITNFISLKAGLIQFEAALFNLYNQRNYLVLP